MDFERLASTAGRGDRLDDDFDEDLGDERGAGGDSRDERKRRVPKELRLLKSDRSGARTSIVLSAREPGGSARA